MTETYKTVSRPFLLDFTQYNTDVMISFNFYFMRLGCRLKPAKSHFPGRPSQLIGAECLLKCFVKRVQRSTMTLKPPQNMRLPSKGIDLALHMDFIHGSFITLRLMLSFISMDSGCF
ncbi:MAG: hypothetical protein A2Z83_00810 [Omnitrophica bacterium GWA2_52_8]|nr:MAG: hypothetical protein A2Z83_00810 [Omnitrophica bacterium GWA2_52_8]